MVGHYRRQEDEAYITLNRVIHEAFIDGARNPRLADVYRREHGRLSTLRYFAPKSPSQWDEAVDEHEQMMSALHRRDGRRFAQIARDHMRHKANVVLQTIDALQSRSRAGLIRERRLRIVRWAAAKNANLRSGIRWRRSDAACRRYAAIPLELIQRFPHQMAVGRGPDTAMTPCAPPDRRGKRESATPRRRNI